jgi:hypothetical protein
VGDWGVHSRKASFEDSQWPNSRHGSCSRRCASKSLESGDALLLRLAAVEVCSAFDG